MVRKILIVAAVVLGAIGLWYAVTRLFPSEKRRLEWTLEDIRKAMETGDPQKCLAFVSPQYNYDGMDYKTLEEFAKGALALSGPMEIRTLKQHVTLLPDRTFAVAAGEILSLPCQGSKLLGPVRTSWNVMFRKEGKEWKVWQIELNSLNDQAVGGLRGLLRFAAEP